MKRPGVIAIAVLGALLAGLLIYGVVQNGDDRSIEKAISRGDYPPAPDHVLPTLEGSGRQSLADYRGRVVFLNFYASWCPPCAHEAPTLRSFQQSLDTSKATMLGVAYKDFASDSTTFLKKHGLTYPSLRDNKLQLAPKYGTNALPETFVIDRRGRIVAVSRGEVTRAFLDASLKRALAA